MTNNELTAITKRFAAELKTLKKQIRTLQQGQRQEQLPYSSIDDGQLPVLDSNGVVRQVIGVQSDGTVTTNDVNAPSPPVPSLPLVGPAINGLSVGWDGTFATSAPLNQNSRFTLNTLPWQPVNGAVLVWQQDATDEPYASLNGTGTANPGMQSEQVPVNGGDSYSAYAFISSALGWITGGTVTINWFDVNGVPISSVTSTAVAISIATEQVLSVNGVAPQDGYATVTIALAGTPTSSVVVKVYEGSIIDQTGSDTPADFWHVEVHLSQSAGFTPNSSTLQGTMVAAGALACLNLLDDTTYYAALVAVNTSGSSSLPSAEANGSVTSVLDNLPPGSITAPYIGANAIVAGMIAAGAIDDQVLNSVQINAGTVSASDLLLQGVEGGLYAYGTGGAITQSYTVAGTYTWVCPAGVTTVQAECWGSGGGGGHGGGPSNLGGGGGGAGEYSQEPSVAVIPGNSYTVIVPAGGIGGTNASNGQDGGTASFAGVALAHGGRGALGSWSGSSTSAPGSGGSGSTATIHNNGGGGGWGENHPSLGIAAGGGGGGSGATSGQGNAGTAASGTRYGPGAVALPNGGPGGDGGKPLLGGQTAGVYPPTGPGGGGGGGSSATSGNLNGASGRAGQARLTYTSGAPALVGAISGVTGPDPVIGMSVPEGAWFDHIQATAGFTAPDGSAWSSTGMTLGTKIIRDTWKPFNPLSAPGWSVPVGGFAQYRLSAENELQISAVIKSPDTNTVNGVTIATFPSGYRPASTHYFPVSTTVLPSGTPSASPQMSVAGNGNLVSTGIGGNTGSGSGGTVGIEVKIPLDL